MLVMLGFTACEPDEEPQKMYGPPEAKFMYSTPTAQFEQKPQVPDNAAVVSRENEEPVKVNEDE